MIQEDPFASAPGATPDPEPADTGSVWDTPPAAAPEPAVRAGAPVAFNEGRVTLTFKGGTGFDAPWIVVYGESLQDALDQVSGENARVLAELMVQVQKAGQHFASLGGSAPANNGGGNGQRQGPPPGAQEAPNGEKRYCRHGEMKFRSGTSKRTGKPYKMFVCQSGDRNDECDPQYLNSRN